MNLEIIIAAGYDTPDLMTAFLMKDNEEQDRIYRAAAEKYGKILRFCNSPKSAA